MTDFDASGLYGYQAKNAQSMLASLRRFGAALDASSAGTGKTFSAIGVARAMNVKPLVVCPKAVIPSWHRAATHLGGEVFAVNYEKLRTGKTEFGNWDGEGNRKKFVFNTESVGMVIWDECHKNFALSSLNAKMGIASKRQRIPSLWLSTTAAQNPLQMKAMGYALNLHSGTDFWLWAKKNGCVPGVWGGLQFIGGHHILKRLHSEIFPDRGVRTTIDSLGDDFPESQITAELYDLNDGGQIDELYAEMKESLGRLRDKMADDADLEHPLTKLLRARQKVELLKVPVFAELADDALEEGMSVVLFLNFNDSLDELSRRLKVNGSVIRGGQSDMERQAIIDAFQRGDTRIIVANQQAGGVGVSLHDLHGDKPRLALISPSYSAVNFVQTLGRVWRQGGKSKGLQRVVLAAGTVEEKVQKQLNKKLQNLSLLNDNDLVEIFD